VRQSGTFPSTRLNAEHSPRETFNKLVSFNLSLAHNLLFSHPEVRMLAEDTSISSYLVEISGWDEEESFFVEKSQLSCDGFACKLITLQHRLCDGSLIFLRLLNSDTPLTAIPIAYEVHFVGSDLHGFNQFSLLPAHPRQPSSRYSIN
jgi:hypothetical protein